MEAYDTRLKTWKLIDHAPWSTGFSVEYHW